MEASDISIDTGDDRFNRVVQVLLRGQRDINERLDHMERSSNERFDRVEKTIKETFDRLDCEQRNITEKLHNRRISNKERSESIHR